MQRHLPGHRGLRGDVASWWSQVRTGRSSWAPLLHTPMEPKHSQMCGKRGSCESLSQSSGCLWARQPRSLCEPGDAMRCDLQLPLSNPGCLAGSAPRGRGGREGCGGGGGTGRNLQLPSGAGLAQRPAPGAASGGDPELPSLPASSSSDPSASPPSRWQHPVGMFWA